mgnify:CR=1 FL=1
MGGFGGRLELLMVGLLSACCWRCRSAGADLTLSAGADLALPVGVSCRQSLTRSHNISISSSVGVLSSRMSVILVGLVEEAVRYIMLGTWYHHICREVFSSLAFCCGMPCLDSKMEGICRELALKYVSDLPWQNYVRPYSTEIDGFPGSKSRNLSFVVSCTHGNRKKPRKWCQSSFTSDLKWADLRTKIIRIQGNPRASVNVCKKISLGNLLLVEHSRNPAFVLLQYTRN